MIWFGKSFIKFCKSFINFIKLVSTQTCSSARVRATWASTHCNICGNNQTPSIVMATTKIHPGINKQESEHCQSARSSWLPWVWNNSFYRVPTAQHAPNQGAVGWLSLQIASLQAGIWGPQTPPWVKKATARLINARALGQSEPLLWPRDKAMMALYIGRFINSVKIKSESLVHTAIIANHNWFLLL